MSLCEMGSVNLTTGIWLSSAVGQLHSAYAHLHPYVAVALCLAGTVMNLVTVVVLTRPSMRSPVNSLLSAVALCDILVMTSVLVFVSHFMIAAAHRCDISDWSRAWAYFLFAHAQTTVIFHATSIWLTVLLAQIRVFTIRRATTGPTDAVSSANTFFVATATLLAVVIANIPNFLTFEIVERPAVGFCSDMDEEGASGLSLSDNSTTGEDYLYHVIASEEDCGLLKVAFWMNGILFKVVPCFMLTFSIVTLLKIIRDVSHRRKSLAQVMNKKRMPRDHTTPMLVAVLSIFLVAELPQGILHVCNAIFTKSTFYDKIYQPLGDVMDLLSLLNSAVNFIIYCAMSRKFRCVFLQLMFSLLPDAVYRKYMHDWSGLVDMEISRHKPSGMTDMTKTEQLALTSHRVSATSMLIRTASKENLTSTKTYTGNLLSVEQQPSTRSLSIPRVSFDVRPKDPFDTRSSLEIHEIRLPIPNVGKTASSSLPLRVIRRWWDWAARAHPDSPQRRMNILQCETSTTAY